MNENALKWVKELETTDTPQATGWLRENTPEGAGRCCLGVACDVYQRETGLGEWRWVATPEALVDGFWEFVTDNPEYADAGSLPAVVYEWLGVGGPEGDYVVRTPDSLLPDTVENKSLIVHNDDDDYTFAEIAAVIRSEPEGLFT